jgi:hypothetical protein
MKRVLCNAIVDRCEIGSFTVTVSGRDDHAGIVRVYTMRKASEDAAAQEGMRRFVEEMGGDL